MFQMLIFLVIGISVGYFNIIPEKYSKIVDKVPYISLLIILFLMGIKIGIDPQTFRNINVIGLKAFIISIGSILGSLICMKIFLNKVDLFSERQEEQ